MGWNLLASVALCGANAIEEAPWKPLGVELRSTEVAASARFYEEGLGFTTVSSYPGRGGVLLELDGFVLVLRPAPAGAAAPPDTGEVIGPYLNLVVGDLERAMDRAVEAGAAPCTLAGEPRAMVLGRSVRLADPGGHPFHLIELAERGSAAESGAHLFNVGLRVDGLETLEPLITGLGFDVVTRSYLPRTLPFHWPGVAHSRSNLVLHRHPGELPASSGSLLFEAANLDAAARGWSALGLDERGASISANPLGRSRAFSLPGGIELRLIERDTNAEAPRR